MRALKLLLVLAVFLMVTGCGETSQMSSRFTIFIPQNYNQPTEITVGPDGNLWFIQPVNTNAPPVIGRITPAGTITELPLPDADANLGAITTGPDGNLWFTNLAASAIGRMTPKGTITEFPLPPPFFRHRSADYRWTR